jgi:cytochrome c oxidase assembly protein subunit 11
LFFPLPPDASLIGLYFHKIQCFCFEQQRLGPQEEIDMPVFFFIDPEILEDASMNTTDVITLSYTFFKIEEEDVEERSQADAPTAATAVPATTPPGEQPAK